MPIYQLDDLTPNIDPDAFLFENTTVIGDVTLHAGASLWPGTILRGDSAPIVVGANSNIQDGCVLHADPGFPMTVAENVTVGHQAMLHGCTIGAGSLIGIQAVVLNGAVIGRDCLIGAGALVPEGRHIPDRSLVIGVGKVVRTLDDEEIAGLHANTQRYVARAQLYRNRLRRLA
ncbi:gamma carbonic anhydrase family protein [Pseudomonas sp. S 311-6]|jgi:carbonic anhydrase/acetyltransferase-like protein (isoleucine patch superfamily)|uniref:Anhydrase n=1 Tax=Kerstersia gyiorum TaxID=206506 RepID=A0A171KVM7_9BURK|nr:gamma carbonic anhydrase family protein [Kerstersia gyiorum]AZV94590.1 gamma carbonic anhydrase family protein [Bordetella sp. J329]MCO7638433.1 gamma carbonic anhydrase family protein [Pseudomonas sp. S 311-6]KAB0542625.1 gamma carbonic anhydrase family protein [Kerstersia gyiorum]KKO72944.1 anhydrase [Kerstersia gyiorum]MCH4273268.1 gamma carbonic anhydrase family protein [Kerstersia gyiorum]